MVARGIQFAYLLPGIVFASLSAALSLTAFWPRKFPTLDPWELRQFLTYDTEAAGLKVHDTIAAAVSRGALKLLCKGRYLKGALLLLLLAAITFGIGILSTTYSANTGRIHHGTQQQVRGRTPSPAAPSPTAISSRGG